MFLYNRFCKTPWKLTKFQLQVSEYVLQINKKTLPLESLLGVQLYLLTLVLLMSEVRNFVVTLQYLSGSGNLLVWQSQCNNLYLLSHSVTLHNSYNDCLVTAKDQHQT